MSKRTAPGDVANLFIRCLLADAGALFGGLTREDWIKTVEIDFGGLCAYTGVPLTIETAVMEHLVAHNRESLGLHSYGNVVPATKAANDAKKHLNYIEFIKTNNTLLANVSDEVRNARIEKIKTFVQKSGYNQSMVEERGLRAYAISQYEMIKKLCEINKQYVSILFGEESSSDKASQSYINKTTLELAGTE